MRDEVPLYRAFVRTRGQDLWQQVTCYRRPFHAPKHELANYVNAMQSRFPRNEYRIEKINA